MDSGGITGLPWVGHHYPDADYLFISLGANLPDEIARLWGINRNFLIFYPDIDGRGSIDQAVFKTINRSWLITVTYLNAWCG